MTSAQKAAAAVMVERRDRTGRPVSDAARGEEGRRIIMTSGKRYHLAGPDIPDESVVLPSGRMLTEEARQEIIDGAHAAAQGREASPGRPGRHASQSGA